MKPYLKIYKMFLIVSLWIAPVTNAQNAEQLVKDVQNRYNMLDNFRSDFEQIVFNKDGKELIRLDGEFIYTKEGKFKIDFGNKLIISNGEFVYNVDNDLNRVVISSSGDRSNSFSLDKFIFEIPDLCDIELIQNSPDKKKLKFIPRNNIGFNKAEITLSKKNIVNKIEITDFTNNVIVFALSNIKIDEDITGVSFNFNPSEEAEIIDLR
ncbi:MAG: outer membrane lipoprotein carrier protein LolA [Melioribacteraceae bacterium]|nr:outer membrane lipoprotein carrier protein LolA [Melioribacteraceae bacterium]